MVGYIEAMTGIGLIMGPLIGSLLFAYGGYSFTFHVFAALFMTTACLIKCLFPEHIDRVEEVKEECFNDGYIDLPGEVSLAVKAKEIGYSDLFKIKRFMFAGLSGTLGYLSFSYLEPILAFRLSEFSISQSQIGLFFTILPVFYILSSVMVQFIPRGIQKRAILISAAFASCFVNLMTGPSQLLFMPNSLWLMIIG